MMHRARMCASLMRSFPSGGDSSSNQKHRGDPASSALDSAVDDCRMKCLSAKSIFFALLQDDEDALLRSWKGEIPCASAAVGDSLHFRIMAIELLNEKLARGDSGDGLLPLDRAASAVATSRVINDEAEHSDDDADDADGGRSSSSDDLLPSYGNIVDDVSHHMPVIVKSLFMTERLLNSCIAIRKANIVAATAASAKPSSESSEPGASSDVSIETLTRLLSCHYLLVIRSLEIARTRSPSDPTLHNLPKLLVEFVEACSSSEEGGVSFLPAMTGKSLPLKLEALFAFLARQLDLIEDAGLACLVLDILVLLTHGLNKAEAVKDLTWKVMGTIFAFNQDLWGDADPRFSKLWVDRSNLPPFAFLQSSKRYLDRFEGGSVPKLCVDGLLRVGGVKKGGCLILKQTTLTLWGLLGGKTLGSAEGVKFCTMLASEIGKERSAVTIPLYNDVSHEVYFEMVSWFILTALIAAEPLPNQPGQQTKQQQKDGPYINIYDLMNSFLTVAKSGTRATCGSSKKIAATVAKTSEIMLRVCDWKVGECIAWRNKQPLLNDDDGDTVDFASVRFLEGLIGKCGEVCGVLVGICRKMKADVVASATLGSANAGSNGRSRAAGGMRAISGFKVLTLRCEKFVASLGKLCATYGLPSITVDGITNDVYQDEVDDEQQKKKKKKTKKDTNATASTKKAKTKQKKQKRDEEESNSSDVRRKSKSSGKQTKKDKRSSSSAPPKAKAKESKAAKRKPHNSDSESELEFSDGDDGDEDEDEEQLHSSMALDDSDDDDDDESDGERRNAKTKSNGGGGGRSSSGSSSSRKPKDKDRSSFGASEGVGSNWDKSAVDDDSDEELINSGEEDEEDEDDDEGSWDDGDEEDEEESSDDNGGGDDGDDGFGVVGSW